MAGRSDCPHPELYYSTRTGDAVEWLCPSCRQTLNLGPPRCDHLGLRLRELKGAAESVYTCVVSACTTAYARPAIQ